MKYLELNKKGTIKTFKGDFPELESCLRLKKETRLSSIVPVSSPLRVLWKGLRFCFELLGYDRGIEWLRSWKVGWVVVVEGKELKTFKDRRKALAWEKEYFIKRGLS